MLNNLDDKFAEAFQEENGIKSMDSLWRRLSRINRLHRIIAQREQGVRFHFEPSAVARLLQQLQTREINTIILKKIINSGTWNSFHSFISHVWMQGH